MTVLDQLLARYRVEAFLGNKSGAWFYRIVPHDAPDRRFLLRIFQPAVGDKKEQEFAEADGIELEHPAVTKYWEAGKYPDPVKRKYLYYAIEDYYDPDDLVVSKKLADKEQLPVETVLQIAADLANGLAYLEKRGRPHGAVKPSSVLLLPDGRACFMHPVIAQLTNVEREDPDPDKLATVSDYCRAPEGRGTDLTTAIRADVYGLATVLFLLACGRLPRTNAATQDDPELGAPNICQAREDLPMAFAAVLALGMQKDKRRRFQNAVAIAEDLRSVSRGMVPKHAKEAFGDLLAEEQLDSISANRRTKAVRRSTEEGLGDTVRKKPLPFVLAGVAVLAVLLGVIIVGLFGSGDPSATGTNQGDERVAWRGVSPPVAGTGSERTTGPDTKGSEAADPPAGNEDPEPVAATGPESSGPQREGSAGAETATPVGQTGEGTDVDPAQIFPPGSEGAGSSATESGGSDETGGTAAPERGDRNDKSDGEADPPQSNEPAGPLPLAAVAQPQLAADAKWLPLIRINFGPVDGQAAEDLQGWTAYDRLPSSLIRAPDWSGAMPGRPLNKPKDAVDSVAIQAVIDGMLTLPKEREELAFSLPVADGIYGVRVHYLESRKREALTMNLWAEGELRKYEPKGWTSIGKCDVGERFVYDFRPIPVTDGRLDFKIVKKAGDAPITLFGIVVQAAASEPMPEAISDIHAEQRFDSADWSPQIGPGQIIRNAAGSSHRFWPQVTDHAADAQGPTALRRLVEDLPNGAFPATAFRGPLLSADDELRTVLGRLPNDGLLYARVAPASSLDLILQVPQDGHYRLDELRCKHLGAQDTSLRLRLLDPADQVLAELQSDGFGSLLSAPVDLGRRSGGERLRLQIDNAHAEAVDLDEFRWAWSRLADPEPSALQASILIDKVRAGRVGRSGAKVDVPFEVQDPEGGNKVGLTSLGLYVQDTLLASADLKRLSSRGTGKLTWKDASEAIHRVHLRFVDADGRVGRSEDVDIIVGNPPLPKAKTLMIFSKNAKIGELTRNLPLMEQACDLTIRSKQADKVTDQDLAWAELVLLPADFDNPDDFKAWGKLSQPILSWSPDAMQRLGFIADMGNQQNRKAGVENGSKVKWNRSPQTVLKQPGNITFVSTDDIKQTAKIYAANGNRGHVVFLAEGAENAIARPAKSNRAVVGFLANRGQVTDAGWQMARFIVDELLGRRRP